MAAVLISLKLYGPLLAALFFFISLFLLKKPTRRSRVSIDLFGFIQYKLPISNLARLRIISVILAVICISSYLFFDYTVFFPMNLTMEVYFDREAIQSGLSQLSEKEIRELDIPADFYAYQHIYYEDLDTALSKILKVECFFTQRGALIHSEGTSMFVVEKVSGIQNYYIRESNGILTNILERPGHPPISFKSFFDKAVSDYDNLHPTLSDIFLRQTVILRPMFKQIIAENYKSDGVIFNHTLFGVTKVRIFPFPEIGKTVYLFYLKNHGLIPIAVAEYR